MTADIRNTKTRKSLAAKLLRPKVAIPTLLVFLILISPFLVRGWFLRGVPNPPEPFDVKPLLEYSVPDAENAFNDYRLAKSLYIQPSMEVSQLRDQIYIKGWHLANDDIRQFLLDNEDALLAWKAGTEKDRALYVPIHEWAAMELHDFVQNMREFTRTAMLLCKKLQAKGEPQEAWQWYRAALRASRHLGTKGTIFERIVGAGLFGSPAVQLEQWATDPNLTSADLKLALQQLRHDWELTEKTSTVMKIDYLMYRRSLREHPESLAKWYASDVKVDPKYWYFVGEPELTERLLRFYYHNQIQFCDLPFSQRPGVVSNLGVFDDPAGFTIDDVEWSLPGYRDAYERSALAGALFGEIMQFYAVLQREEARYWSYIKMFASEAFRRDHGRLPETLDELVPEYLEEIPFDSYETIESKQQLLPSEMDSDNLSSQLRLPAPEPLTAPKP